MPRPLTRPEFWKLFGFEHEPNSVTQYRAISNAVEVRIVETVEAKTLALELELLALRSSVRSTAALMDQILADLDRNHD